MGEIDKTLISVADDTGAGLELGGGRDEEPTEGRDAGVSYLHGDPVAWPRPLYPQVSFTPDHLCAVYIQFASNGIIVRQGYLASNSQDVNVFRPRAATILRHLKTQSYANLDYYGTDFENFSLGSQQIVVLYIDNPPSYVEFTPDPQSDLDRIVRFSQFGPTDDQPRESNKAFYNLRKLIFNPTEQGNQADQDSLVHNVAYALDFWNTRSNGYAIPDHAPADVANHVIFSMNIHLAMHIPGKTTFVPVILDPDTGNMGANP